MTGHEYLAGVLDSQKMQDEDLITLRQLRKEIEGVLREEYGSYPRFYYAGSYGKKTMIRASFDLDIVIYFPPTETSTLKTIYSFVHQTLIDSDYKVHPKTVSLQLPYEGGFHIDVVPGRAQDNTYQYATLYKNGENSTMQTSIKIHIDSVRDSRDIIKLMKLWRVCHSLEWKTFALEQTVVRALKGQRKNDYERCLIKVFEFFQDNILTIRLVDPANSNNVIEMSQQIRESVQQAAINAIAAKYWSEVVW